MVKIKCWRHLLVALPWLNSRIGTFNCSSQQDKCFYAELLFLRRFLNRFYLLCSKFVMKGKCLTVGYRVLVSFLEGRSKCLLSYRNFRFGVRTRENKENLILITMHRKWLWLQPQPFFSLFSFLYSLISKYSKSSNPILERISMNLDFIQGLFWPFCWFSTTPTAFLSRKKCLHCLVWWNYMSTLNFECP